MHSFHQDSITVTHCIWGSQSCLSRLQLVQNSVPRFVINTRKRENITPVLVGVHWLPVEYRIQFKILLFVYKFLTGLGDKLFI